MPLTQSTYHDGALEYICRHYSVPAAENGRVLFEGKPGTIVGTTGHYLRVQIDGENHADTYHPTWHMEYVDA